MDLENIGLDCPTYDVGDCSMTTFEIGEFYPIGANNGKLVIKQNDVVIGEFFADQSDETEVNIDLSAYATIADVEADIDTAKGEMQELIDAKASIAELEEEANLREEEDTRLAGEINQLGTELNAEVNARTQADTTLTNAVNTKATISALTAETTNRENADNELQSQIDAITSQSDVVDIVGTYAELQAYDTSHLGNNDIVKVLTDSTHDNAPSYFRWNKTAGTWNYVGSESVAYTKAEADDRFVPKTRTINGKALSANVTLTTNDLTNDSGYLTESDLTDYVKNTDYATSNTGGVFKASNVYAVGVNQSTGTLYSSVKTHSEYDSMTNSAFVSKGTLENVLNGRKYLMPEYTLELPTTGEANKLYLTPATEQPDIEATASGKDIELADASEGDLIDWAIKGDTEQASYTGKNLLRVLESSFNATKNGVTASYNTNDGTITLNGTCTADNTVFYFMPTSESIHLDGKYILSVFYVSGSISNQTNETIVQVQINNYTSSIKNRLQNQNTSVTATKTNQDFNRNNIRIDNGVVLNNYKIKVQLEQGSTATDFEPYVGGSASPNPDYPQEIKTVTGRQTVGVVGKNLWIYSDDIFYKANNSTYSISSDGSLSVFTPMSTAYANVAFRLDLPDGTYTFSLGNVVHSNQNMTYKRMSLSYYVGNTRTAVKHIDAGTPQTITVEKTDERIYVLEFWTTWATGFSNTATFSNIQIEKGSVATTYQPYSGQEVELNLGKNLYVHDPYKVNYLLGASGNEIEQTGALISKFIPVVSGETYTVNISSPAGSDNDMRVGLYKSDGTFIQRTNKSNTNTFVVPTDCTQIRLSYFYSNQNIQLERGDKATEYAPYFEPIELCKLGDYQDRIYKDGDTWKIEKKTAKVLVTSSTGVFKQAYGGNTYSVSAPNMNQSTTNKNVYSEYFVPLSWEERVINTQNSVYSRPNDSYSIEVRNTQWATVDSFKSWAVDNLSFYYALETPTTTEITYQPLIDQLNALETLTTVKGYNHITTDTPSVQPFLEFGYFRPDPTVTKDEWLWVENHYEQLGGERRYTHNLSVNHNTAQGHWDYAFTIVGKEASHYTQLAQVAYYLFREHAGLHIPVSGTYTEGNDVYLLTKITASSLNQVTIEMRKLSDGSVRSISTGAVPVLDTIS